MSIAEAAKESPGPPAGAFLCQSALHLLYMSVVLTASRERFPVRHGGYGMRVSAEEIRKLHEKHVELRSPYDPEAPEWIVSGTFYVDVPEDEPLTDESFLNVGAVTFRARHIREIDRANVYPTIEIDR